MTQNPETLKNTIDSNDVKCPEISQLMEKSVRSAHELSEETSGFPEIGAEHGFQGVHNHLFSEVWTQKDAKKRRKSPDYRIINANLKSKKQYWKERNRRKQVWQLHCDGLTYPIIAKKLGISERTVQRDMKKVSPYYKGKLLKQLRELQEKQWRKFQSEMDHMTLSQRFKRITDMLCKQRKQMRGREYRRHLVKVFINVDEGKSGIPRISHWPKGNHQKITMPMHLKFFVVIQGMKLYMGGLEMS